MTTNLLLSLAGHQTMVTFSVSALCLPSGIICTWVPPDNRGKQESFQLSSDLKAWCKDPHRLLWAMCQPHQRDYGGVQNGKHHRKQPQTKEMLLPTELYGRLGRDYKNTKGFSPCREPGSTLALLFLYELLGLFHDRDILGLLDERFLFSVSYFFKLWNWRELTER